LNNINKSFNTINLNFLTIISKYGNGTVEIYINNSTVEGNIFTCNIDYIQFK